MGELTKAQLQAAEDRAEENSLGDDDVALQTADAMPKGAGVKGQTLDTAGSDIHGPIHSYTRAEVRKALESYSGGSRAADDEDKDSRATRSRS